MGKVLNQFGVGKHFCIEITEESFDYARNQQSIQHESALDGLYVILPGLNLCFDKFTQATPLQQTALNLLGVGL
ncbi:hypothetical protein [Planktothrix sp. FACHB-1355]|uniref:hypothetical protein n=1 Tax=Planktothrix sp. FACHB-1355 TaxID=2692854 RepID=UPI00168AF671|nr:hypothetical protein [Planktothrix sp. FACHB-1355]